MAQLLPQCKTKAVAIVITCVIGPAYRVLGVVLWLAFSACLLSFGQWILARETLVEECTRLVIGMKGVSVETQLDLDPNKHTSHLTGIRLLRRREDETSALFAGAHLLER